MPRTQNKTGQNEKEQSLFKPFLASRVISHVESVDKITTLRVTF